MRKFNLSALTIFVLVVVLASALLVDRTSTVSAAPEVRRVGLVVAYNPGDNITIVDKDGTEFMFELSPNLKIVPPERADSLAVGVYVTIIAPNNVPNGKHFATGIVIHPGIPEGFAIPSETLPSDPTETVSPTETGTPLTEGTPTETETPSTEETPIETATETSVVSEFSGNSASNPSAGNPPANVPSFVEWLVSVFRQMFSG